MKKHLLQLSLIVSFATTVCAQQNDDGTINPLVQIAKEDYSTARANFKTTLIKQEHSPQKTDSVDKLPAGVSEITFPSANLQLKAWINKPAARNAKKPVVIFLHGGFAFGKEDWDMAQPFRDAGFVVVAPMLRGENGQEGSFSLFYDEVNDVLALARYLQKQFYVDKKRMYITGHSAGGTTALLSALCSRYFRKAATFSASPDQKIFCKYGINPAAIPFDTTNQKEFEMRSPLAYAGSFKCPTRIYLGKREAHFRLSSQQTAIIAKNKGLDVEAIEVEGGHESAVAEEMKLAIAFFNKQ